MEKNYKSKLFKIKTFIFDVDGVLTDGKVIVTTEGEMYRALDTKDGYAMKYAMVKGFKIAIISGGTNEGIRNRFEALGVKDIYLGAHEKSGAFEELINNYKLKSDERNRGWGLQLVSELMDTVEYDSDESGTTVTMTKKREDNE